MELFMTFHSVGNGIIIPTDFHSIIFQRGRLKPPTRYAAITHENLGDLEPGQRRKYDENGPLTDKKSWSFHPIMMRFI